MSDTVPAVNTQEIVDRLRQKLDGAASSAQARTAAGKSTNYLLAIALNAFARAGARKPLTELEQSLVNVFRKCGYGDADLAAIGETFTAASATARTALFPARFAQLDTETGYGMTDLRADMPQLAQEILTSPNLRVRADNLGLALSSQDLATLQTKLAEQGQSVDIEQLRQLTRPAERVNEGTPEPGWRVLCYAVPMASGAADPAEARGFGQIHLRADYVKCLKGTHEAGNDEPFFGFAVTDDVSSRTYQSPEFSMDAGDGRHFPANTLWQGGVSGNGLGIVIDAWEADHSGVYERHKDMLNELVRWFMDQLSPDDWRGLVETVIGDVSGWGVPPWIYALAAGATALVIQVLKNADDHLCTIPVMVPVSVFREWKIQKDIVANNPRDEAIRLLSARPPFSTNPTLRPAILGFILLGAFTEPHILVHMDRDNENHGIYEVTMKVRLP